MGIKFFCSAARKFLQDLEPRSFSREKDNPDCRCFSSDANCKNFISCTFPRMRVVMEDCIFCKIAQHKIPKEFTYEDSDIMVFPDIHPIKPVHLLIMPKAHIPTILELEDGKLLEKIHKIMKDMVMQHGLDDKGFRIVVNGGGAQAIDHLHFHLTGPWGMKADW